MLAHPYNPEFLTKSGLTRFCTAAEKAGFDGIGFSFVNFLDELPYFADEVLPRLERLGLRERR